MSVRESNRRRRVAAVVVVLAVFMTNLDLWVVNVALPSLGHAFSGAGHTVTLADLSWVLNAYAITLAALLIVMGRLGDRIGQKPVFIAGVVLFTVASAACAAAPSLSLLVVARVLQAVGAAAQLPTSLALLLATVPAERRMSATRGWAAVGGLAAASGPVVGGLLVQVDWRWVFVINLPIGLAAVLVGLRVLPTPASRESGPLPDLLGALLVTVAMASVAGALVQAPTWGWLAGRTLALTAVALLAFAWFGFRSSRHASPLMELHLLRLPRFGLAGAGTFVFGVAFAMMLLSNVLWCQQLWGWSPVQTGLALAPGPALVPVVTILSAGVARRFGAGPLVAAGGLLFAAAMGWRAVFASADPSYVRDLLPSMVLGGTGVGLALGTLVAAGVQSLPASRAATGSALVNALRQISATVGVAVLVSLLGGGARAGSVTDFRVVWTVAAGLSLVTVAIGLALSPQRRVAAMVADPVRA